MQGKHPEDVVIIAANRTPIGSFQGQFSTLSAPELGAVAIAAAIDAASLDPNNAIDEVIMGQVLCAGAGQAPVRQASLQAGLPESIPCTGISKVCGSGMKSVMLAYDQIRAGSLGTVVAGGMESMTQAPYLLPKAREGMRLGHSECIDHMFFDGLQNASCGRLMGQFADANALSDGISREEMDNYALCSLSRAQTAISEGRFEPEICPVSVKLRHDECNYQQDELPGKALPEKIPTLKPAFGKDGRVTAANASAISDGAAALVLCSRAQADKLQLKPLATIKAHSSHAQAPSTFTHAPIGAIDKLLQKTGWTVSDVDLFEINEAFAMVVLATIKALDIPHEKTNINGGACALGHPIGASGARILVTLIHALRHMGGRRGIASLCIGGGEAVAIAVELSD